MFNYKKIIQTGVSQRPPLAAPVQLVDIIDWGTPETCTLLHAFFHWSAFLPFLAARVLEDCGAERYPCDGALWEGGHQYTWQWFPHRKVRAIFKVSNTYGPLLRPYSIESLDRVFCPCCKTIWISDGESVLRNLKSNTARFLESDHGGALEQSYQGIL